MYGVIGMSVSCTRVRHAGASKKQSARNQRGIRKHGLGGNQIRATKRYIGAGTHR